MFDTEYLQPARVLRLKNGEDHVIEEEAAAWLARGREGVTRLEDKRDYLTRDQLQLRAQREILNSTGFCDESLMSGLFRRTYNPNYGARPKSRFYDEG
jgi:hypothetical protein